MMKKLAVGSLVTALSLAIAPAAQAVTLDPHAVPARTQITVRHDSGATVSTANAHESRPALSLSKLYLGYWVLKYGAPTDKARVEHMIRVSDDNVATDLDRRYPQAIPSTIHEFGLRETHYTGYWGTTTTSTEDVARFTSRIQHDPIAAPIMTGMANAAPVAADGYRQDFGTSRIPGVIGTKFGWSDNRRIHASVSTAPGFTVAANTYGDAATHTADVTRAVHNAPGALPAAGGSSQAIGARIEHDLNLQGPARQAVRDATRTAASYERQACASANQALAQVTPMRVCN